jgi:hypothetical protein
MDPNENLSEQRRIIARLNEAGPIARLVELVEALDGWLSKGGFVPQDWNWYA